MIKKLVAIVCILAFFSFGSVLLVNSLGSDNWGEEAYGNELSIASTNKVVEIGSTMMLTERIRNRSKDDVWLTPATAKSYILTNQSGKVYYLIPPTDNSNQTYTAVGVITPLAVNAGEIKEWSIKLKINKGIEPGDYELKDMRSITTESKQATALISNSLNVKVTNN